MSQPCRYGWGCRREDCWFTHPEGREIDAVGGPPGGPNGYTPPARAPRSPSGNSDSGFGGGGGGGQAVCRFGVQCNRPDCWFLHPEGRGLDDDDPDLARVQQALEDLETEGGTFGGGDECPCCHGRPRQCETKECKESGACGCILDAIPRGSGGKVVDDTWMDEWFPASRACDCCSGYVYRCKREDDMCQSGTCHCAHQKGGFKVPEE